MLEAFDLINSTGTFAGAHKLKTTVPGVSIHDVGDIDLPLQEAQAQQIIAKARQALFGKGSDTMVDTSVRNTWELDPTQFKLSPGWLSVVSRLCETVSEEAGLGDAKIHAELNNMLLYEKGAMFKAHTDTEKTPGMFGTLVICLPSPHRGGNIVAKHGGCSKTFQTENTAQSYIGWFSDVSHEVLPVTAGYRWVLTYNLAIDPASSTYPGRPSAALALNGAKPLRHTLRRWLSQPKEERDSNFLCYALDHPHTEANISHGALQTRDKVVVDVFHQLSWGMRFHLFLAVLEKSDMGECDGDWESRGRGDYYYEQRYEDEDANEDDENGAFHTMQDVLEREYSIVKLVDLAGHTVGSGGSLDVEDILEGEDAFLGTDAEERAYEGYMGNSGPSAIHFYRRTALVIVPRDNLVDYLEAYGDRSVDNITGYFAKVCVELLAFDRRSALNTWSEFYEEVFYRRCKSATAKPETVALVLVTTLKLKDWGLWNDLITATADEKRVLPRRIFDKVRQELITGEVSFEQIEEGITTWISLLPTLTRQYETIRSLTFLDTDNFDDFEVNDETFEKLCTRAEAWKREVLGRIITQKRSFGTNDGAATVEIAFEEMDFTFFKESTVPMFMENIDKFAFSLGYLGWFHGYISARREDSNRGEMRALYKSLATSLIDCIDASALHSRVGVANRGATTTRTGLVAHEQRTVPAGALQEGLRNTISPELLTDLVDGILTVDVPLPTILKLFFRLTDQANRIDVGEYHPLWFPFLRGLFSLSEKKSVPLTTPRYQHFTIAIFEAYLKNYVGKEPRESSDLRRPPVKCSCSDCYMLNRFLTSSHQKVERFSMNQKRREHLSQKLRAAGIDCSHTTDGHGNPHLDTLIVTKTSNQEAKARAGWISRAEDAVSQFDLFDKRMLRTVLGPDFDDITKFESLRGRTRHAAERVCIGQDVRPVQGPPSTRIPETPQPAQAVQPQQQQQRLPQTARQEAPQQHAHPSLQSHVGPLPPSAFKPYESPAHRYGHPVQHGSTPQPASKKQRLPGLKGLSVLPDSNRPQSAFGSGFGALTPTSGNRAPRPNGSVLKSESPGSLSGSGKKRKASEIEVIDLTLDD